MCLKGNFVVDDDFVFYVFVFCVFGANRTWSPHAFCGWKWATL